MSGRRRQSFWAVDIHRRRVILTPGYECPPNDDLWWVPEMGYSMTVGFHLFETREAAVAKLKQELRESIERLKKNLADDEAALAELGIAT